MKENNRMGKKPKKKKQKWSNLRGPFFQEHSTTFSLESKSQIGNILDKSESSLGKAKQIIIKKKNSPKN